MINTDLIYEICKYLNNKEIINLAIINKYIYNYRHKYGLKNISMKNIHKINGFGVFNIVCNSVPDIYNLQNINNCPDELYIKHLSENITLDTNIKIIKIEYPQCVNLIKCTELEQITIVVDELPLKIHNINEKTKITLKFGLNSVYCYDKSSPEIILPFYNDTTIIIESRFYINLENIKYLNNVTEIITFGDTDISQNYHKIKNLAKITYNIKSDVKNPLYIDKNINLQELFINVGTYFSYFIRPNLFITQLPNRLKKLNIYVHNYYDIHRIYISSLPKTLKYICFKLKSHAPKDFIVPQIDIDDYVEFEHLDHLEFWERQNKFFVRVIHILKFVNCNNINLSCYCLIHHLILVNSHVINYGNALIYFTSLHE